MGASGEGASSDERRLLLGLLRDAHTRLEEASAALDSKAGVLLGFAAATTALAMAQGLPANRAALSLAVSATWAVLLFASVSFLAAALHPVTRAEVPDPGVLIQDYSELDLRAIYAVLGTDFAEAWKRNRQIHQRKAWRVQVAVILLVAGLALFGVDALVVRPLLDTGECGASQQHSEVRCSGQEASKYADITEEGGSIKAGDQEGGSEEAGGQVTIRCPARERRQGQVPIPREEP